MAVTAHDITKRKQTEMARQEIDRRKKEFLALLEHEPGKPMAPISNAV